jgi:MFS family permease
MSQEPSMNKRRSAYLGILLLGIVSLLGDVVYEGSRGIVPDYLGFLGATALIVGLVGGLGDFLGYAMRLVSGVLVDTTRAYWLFIFAGYGLIVSIPLLGFSGGLEMATLLVLVERFGKALRSPSRDTVLSVISKEVGAGKAFGLHELLDQVGAVLGPLMVATLMFATNNNYRYTFSFLLIPFLMLLAALTYTYKRIRARTTIESPKKKEKRERIPRPFYVYTLAVLLNTTGLIPFTLILFKASEIVMPLKQDWIVPLIFLLIQGVDAPAALLSGYAYDKFGISVLTIPFILSLFPPLFAMFDAGLTMLIVSSVFFGLVLGMQESIYRAAVSDLTPISSRGTAYGIFNTAYGAGFLISGALYGYLIGYKAPFIVAGIYVFTMQMAAIVFLLNARSKLKSTQ